ncbi:MAG: CocE/NonD family hydrolase, partial [Candidatus Dormibacteraceae bacterium]
MPVPMRDGTILFADVYHPAEGRPAPVLICRTPYDKGNRAQVNGSLDVLRAVQSGYAVVIQDVRGRYSSGGTFDAFHNEARDGYDTVEWCAGQNWSTGKVGMYGRSYHALTAWQAALARPPHLAAIVPGITASDYHEGWTYQGGAFCLGFNLSWALAFLATETLWRLRAEIPDFETVWANHLAAVDSARCHFSDLPLDEIAALKVEDCAPYYFDWLAHPDYDDFWREIDVEAHYPEIDIPALNVGGWYDIFLGGTLRNYLGMREQGETEAARAGQRLLIGPWAHQTPLSNTVGAVDFGYQTLQNRFGFDHDGV